MAKYNNDAGIRPIGFTVVVFVALQVIEGVR